MEIEPDSPGESPFAELSAHLITFQELPELDDPVVFEPVAAALLEHCAHDTLDFHRSRP